MASSHRSRDPGFVIDSHRFAPSLVRGDVGTGLDLWTVREGVRRRRQGGARLVCFKADINNLLHRKTGRILPPSSRTLPLTAIIPAWPGGGVPSAKKLRTWGEPFYRYLTHKEEGTE